MSNPDEASERVRWCQFWGGSGHRAQVTGKPALSDGMPGFGWSTARWRIFRELVAPMSVSTRHQGNPIECNVEPVA